MKIKETAAKYQTSKKPFTYQDYLNLPDDGKRYEVLKGELVMAPSPTSIHQIVRDKLFVKLFTFVQDEKLGTVITSPLDVVFDEKNVLQPDILFINRRNESIITERNVSGAPDLTIEVLSPSTAYYDLFDKKEIYEKFGVKEYWIVDPMRQWIEVYNPEKGKFKLSQRLEKNGVLKSSVLKDFKLDIKEIFKS